MSQDTDTVDFYGKRFGATWCVLPWIHAASLTDGSTQLCCVAEGVSDVNLNSKTLDDYWKSDYIKDARRRMLAEKKVGPCRRCYEEEGNGYRSHRVMENKNWHVMLGTERINEIVAATAKDGSLESEIIAIDLRLGNTCNLQCIMCQPRESSKWVALAGKIQESVNDWSLKTEWKFKKDINVANYEWYKNTKFWDSLKTTLPHLREIIIAGGEPMIIRQHLNFLKECALEHDVSHINLRYHTNLIEFPEDMIPHWEKFKKVEFFASIDGMHDVANYIRYPSEWEKIEKNLQIIDKMPSHMWLYFLYSVQALNIGQLPDFIRWVRTRGFAKEKMHMRSQMFIHPGLIHWPKYLNPKILPKKMKAEITEKFAILKAERDEDFDKFDGIVSFMNSEDWSSKLSLFSDYLAALDKTRGTDRYKVFPEIMESLDGI